MSKKNTTRRLTDAELALVEQYHSLIYRVMQDLHLDADDAATDTYGEAAMGLIHAAQKYLTDESLQKQRFSTMAYRCIRNALMRQRHKTRRQAETVSLDSALPYGGTRYDLVADERCADPAELVERQERTARLRACTGRSCKVYRFPAYAAAAPRKEAA